MEPYRINCPETLFRDSGSHDQAWPDHSPPAGYKINCHEISFLDNVCENSQSRKGLISDNFHSLVPNTRNANGSKTAKLRTVDSIWVDFQSPVPLDDDVFGIVPCLNYPSIEDALPNELLGVPMNDLCTDNYLPSKENRSNFQGNGYLTTVGKTEKRNKEQPVVESVSSACSVNDVERSRNNERKRYLKKKFRDIGNSEEKAHRARAGLKRSRAAEMHNYSERTRINAKMRALQGLIPNCNKVDEACMLDEAIEYLRRLKIEVQMLAMGTGDGLCIQGPYMPHFSPMGLGMFSMMKMIPFQGPHYSIPNLWPTFPGFSFQALWRLGQQPPMLWDSGVPSLNINSGLDV